MPPDTPSTTPRPFVFVAMPFATSYDDKYELAIKPACDAAGAYAERVDEQIFQENILQRTYNQIDKADLVIADLTGRNANVFYEAGYAHARRKPVVMLARDAADVPFDVRAYPPIVFGEDLVYLKNELERQVRLLLHARGSVSSPLAVPVDVTVNGCVLNQLVEQEVSVRIEDSREFGRARFTVVVQNPVIRIIRTIEMQIGVITPGTYESVSIEYKSKSRDTRVEHEQTRSGMRLHLLRQDFRLLPGTWEKYWLWIRLDRRYEDGDVIGPFIIRILTTTGYFDFPFRMKLTPPSPPEGETA